FVHTAGLDVLRVNLFAALGGCWSPIETTPGWMQTLQKILPTGWTIDAMHKLISFEAGAIAAVPHIIALLPGALLVSVYAIRIFRYP
ncbi:MAG: ABC transporter permease, partial [Woeseia sp.]